MKEKRDSSEGKTWRLTLDEFTEIHNIFQKGIFEVFCPESENFDFDSYKFNFRFNFAEWMKEYPQLLKYLTFTKQKKDA